MKKQTEEEQRNKDTKGQSEADKEGKRDSRWARKKKKEKCNIISAVQNCRLSQPTFLASAAASSDR